MEGKVSRAKSLTTVMLVPTRTSVIHVFVCELLFNSELLSRIDQEILGLNYRTPMGSIRIGGAGHT